VVRPLRQGTTHSLKLRLLSGFGVVIPEEYSGNQRHLV
jgi:hypothetical protein